MVYSPADLEAHIGTDGKAYLLDFSRVFPPEPPRAEIQGSHLFRLLRPELVRSNEVPLCSDASSGFVLDPTDAKEHNTEIQEAFSRLFREIIPNVAQKLNQLSKNALRRFLGANHLLIEVIHANGINVRFIGVLRKYLKNKILRAQVMVEIISRTLKTIMRAELRQAMSESRVPLEHSYKRCVVNLLNQAFGTGDMYWKNTLLPTAQAKFEECLSAQEREPKFCMKTYIQKHLGLGKFFSRFLQVSGLVFNRQSLEEFRKNDELFNYRQPFDIPDLEELGAQVNHMNIVDNAMGFVLKCRAQLRQEENTQRLCRIALRSFESALYSNPKHVFSLQHYAGTLAVMGRYRQASDYYKLALQVDNSDANTLFDYSCFLLDVGNYTEAFSFFERLILLAPPELFSYYRKFSRKMRELPNHNQVLQDIHERLRLYFPSTSSPKSRPRLETPQESTSSDKGSKRHKFLHLRKSKI